jgi:hypothetical protein
MHDVLMTSRVRLAASSALAVTGVVSAQLFYVREIIPRLDGWLAIPGSWYVPLLLPALVGFLGAGAMLRDGRELVMAATAVVFLGFLPFAHTASRPVASWPTAVLSWYVVSATCLAVSFVPARWVSRRRLAATSP